MNTTKLHVSALQFDIHWENPDQNLATIEKYLRECPSDTDLVVLPEMFTTGFCMRPQAFAQTMKGKWVCWMQEMAKKYHIYLCGSLIIEDDGYVNRFVCSTHEGELLPVYDKRHLFSMANEQNHYKPGNQRVIWNIKGWKVFPQICYDLRFPVWSRNNLDYDVALYPANWPQRRDYPWKTLLRARAIENQAYIVGVNRVGEDGNGVDHNGCSAIIDPIGTPVAEPMEHQAGWFHAELRRDALEAYRKKFPFLPDADGFKLLE
jgi:predicted amidohydrolase